MLDGCYKGNDERTESEPPISSELSLLSIYGVDAVKYGLGHRKLVSVKHGHSYLAHETRESRQVMRGSPDPGGLLRALCEQAK